MPCESRTRLSSLEGWRLCRSAKSTAKRKERESNPQGLLLACFRDRCHRPLACPSVEAAAAGIEPAKGRLTGACLYQHRPHRNRSQGGRTRTCDLKLPELARCQASLHSGKVGAGRFEPPISCSRSTRVSRLPHTPIRTAPSGSRTRTSAMARQQATATSWARRIAGRIVKDQSTGWDSNPRRRITGAESWPLDYQCFAFSGIKGARTLTVLVKSQACCH